MRADVPKLIRADRLSACAALYIGYPSVKLLEIIFQQEKQSAISLSTSDGHTGAALAITATPTSAPR